MMHGQPHIRLILVFGTNIIFIRLRVGGLLSFLKNMFAEYFETPKNLSLYPSLIPAGNKISLLSVFTV
jgi:hypothetical protein